MRDFSKGRYVPLVRAIACQVYLAGLALYPKSFRRRFGPEMSEVFQEALDDRLQQGYWAVFGFLFHELAEAPGSILNQYVEARPFWLKPYPMNIAAFTASFILLGFIETAGLFQGPIGLLGYWISLLVIGGISSLAIGYTLAPDRRRLVCFAGAVGFLLANTLVGQLYNRIFPIDYADIPISGAQFLIIFGFQILAGCVFGLFIGIASGKWHNLFQWTGLGGLGFLAGFFVNRLSAALMQSFLIHSPTQNIALTDIPGVIAYIVVPFVLEGVLLGTLFGGTAQRLNSIPA